LDESARSRVTPRALLGRIGIFLDESARREFAGALRGRRDERVTTGVLHRGEPMLRWAGLRWAAVAARQTGWHLQRRRVRRAAFQPSSPNQARNQVLASLPRSSPMKRDRAGAPCDARPGGELAFDEHPAQGVSDQAVFSRRRSRSPRAPVTRASTEPIPAGSISGTALVVTALTVTPPRCIRFVVVFWT